MFRKTGLSICCANTHNTNHDKQWLRSGAIVFYLAANGRNALGCGKRELCRIRTEECNIEAPNKTSSASCFGMYRRISSSETNRF